MGIPLTGVQQAVHRPTPREVRIRDSFLVQHIPTFLFKCNYLSQDISHILSGTLGSSEAPYNYMSKFNRNRNITSGLEHTVQCLPLVS